MGHQHQGPWVAVQPALQPLHGGSIQMVGGLIQQQHIRAGHQGGGQANPLPVAPREVRYGTLEIADAELLQHFLALLLEAPGLFIVHALAQLAQFGQQRFVLWSCCHCLAEGAEAQQQVALGTTALENLLQHGQAGGDTTLLTHQLDPQPGGTAPFPRPEWFDTRQHLQQGGLTGTVRADQPQPFTFPDVQLKIGEQGADAEVLGGTHKADQTHEVRVDS